MNKIKRFFNALFNQDYVFSVVSKFMGVFIAVIYSIFFNRYLGAELKGESAIIQNYVSIISSIICLGMYQAYPFYKKKEKDVFYPFLNNMTSLYIIVFAVMATVGALVASFWDTNIGVALIIVPIQAYYISLRLVKHKVNLLLALHLRVVELNLVGRANLCTKLRYNLTIYGNQACGDKVISLTT